MLCRRPPTGRPRPSAALGARFPALFSHPGRVRQMKSLTRVPPKVEQSGNVKVITFTDRSVRDVDDVLARELEGLTEALGDCHLLLDFTNVEYLSSVELGTLITLHKK